MRSNKNLSLKFRAPTMLETPLSLLELAAAMAKLW